MGKENIEVCLVHPNNEKILGGANTDPPLGLASIGGVLRNEGYGVRVEDLSVPSGLSDRERLEGADVYGLTIYTCAVPWAKEKLEEIKASNPTALVVAGGSHPTARPKEMLDLDFDVVVIGEGELAMKDLVNEFAKHGRTKERIFNYGPIPKQEMVILPGVDAYDLLQLDRYTRIVGGEKATSVVFSRGCPWRCYFCASSLMFRRTRYVENEKVLRDLGTLKEKGFNSVIFYDDTFTFRPKLKELLEGIADLDLTFRANGRADVVAHRPEVLPLLRDAGCKTLAFGIESGSDRVLGIYNKKITAGQNRQALLATQEAGIEAKAYLMVSPFDDEESIRQTVDLMVETQPHEWTVFAFVPFPGTEFGDHPERHGLQFKNRLDPEEFINIYGNYKGGFVASTPTCSLDQLEELHARLVSELETKVGWHGDVQSYMKKMSARKV